MEIDNCKIVPLDQREGGWWHSIKDGTGEILGFSGQKAEGEGGVDGIVRIRDGKSFLEF